MHAIKHRQCPADPLHFLFSLIRHNVTCIAIATFGCIPMALSLLSPANDKDVPPGRYFRASRSINTGK